MALGEALAEVLGDAELEAEDFALASGSGTIFLMLWPGTAPGTSIVFTGPV